MGELIAGSKEDIWDAGVRAWIHAGAYANIVDDDMPAVSKFMNFKGHRGLSPCRLCRLCGCLCPNSSSGTGGQYYYPIKTPRRWTCQSELRALRHKGQDYNPLSLPL
jgi:hypothetical protein